MFTIYALVDPRDGAVRYVGCTCNLRARFASHLHESAFGGEWVANKPVNVWLRELRALSVEPIVRVLAQAKDRRAAARREREQVQLHRDAGADLLNVRRPGYPLRREAPRQHKLRPVRAGKRTTYHVYTLTDPRTGEVRCVGCAQNVKVVVPLLLDDADSARQSRKLQWVRELLAADLQPALDVVHSTGDVHESYRVESEWIAKIGAANLLSKRPSRSGFSYQLETA